jgi:adenylate kinase
VSQLNLIIMGPPGAGKGTQAANLVDDFEIPHLATGDMMRAIRKEDSDLGRKIAKILSDGGLVDDDIVIEVLFKNIEEQGEDGFLLDGFPRTTPQFDALAKALEDKGKQLTAVLMIEVPDEDIVKRMSGRRVCEKGHTYHVEFNPPEKEGVCDIDDLPLEQRDDDKPETVKARLATYHEQTEPQAARYDDLGLLRRFDGTQSPEEVHHHIRSTVRTLRLEEEL